ncbi:MAG: PAS domain S-box protein [Chloroflexi bacterium]|nr:PAS domain S-box protein [Chloroflexota bacterium]
MKKPDAAGSVMELRKLLEILPDPIFLVDLDSLNILEVNPAACNLYGYSRAELVGQPVLMVSAEPARSSRRLAEIQKGRLDQIAIVRHRRKDGSTFPASLSLSTTEIEDRPTIVGMIRDHTVQEIIENQLQHLNERMSVTLRALPDLMIEVDAEGRYIDYYASRPDLLFIPFEQQIGRTIEEVLPPEAAKITRATLEEARQNGVSQSAPYSLPHSDGLRYYESTISRKSLGDDVQPSFIVLVRDITDRVLTEQALEESRGRYRRLVEFSSDVIFAADPKGMVIFVNPAVADFGGYSPEDLIGKNYLEFVSPEWVEVTERFYDAQLASRVPETTFEFQVCRKDGALIWVEQNTTLVVRDGKVEGFQGIMRDITARKERELALASEFEEATTAARTDLLTGLLNRRAVFDVAQQELDLASRLGHPLILMMADLDNLKNVNDEHGHSQGDAYIQLLAVQISETVRGSDRVGRMGGDEFLVILPNTTLEGGQRVAGKILQAIRRTRLGLPGGGSLPLSASLGLTAFKPGESPSAFKAMLEQADRALYHAKQSGKNTFAAYSPEMSGDAERDQDP